MLTLLRDVVLEVLLWPYHVGKIIAWYIGFLIRYRALVRAAAWLNFRASQIEELLDRIKAAADEAEQISEEAVRVCSRMEPQ